MRRVSTLASVLCVILIGSSIAPPSARATGGPAAAVTTAAPPPGRDARHVDAGPIFGGDVACRAGWPVNLHAPGAGFPYTPTLFDVDHDGADEIFLTGGNTFGLRGDGSFLAGWPTTEHTSMGYGTNEQKPGPSAADLESDGDVEIMWSERDWWAGSSRMWCFNGRESNGSNVPGFPQFAPDDYSNALDVPFVLGDADGNGRLEAWGPHTRGNNFVHYRVSAFDDLGNRLFTRDIGAAENILDLYFGDVDGNGTDEFFAVSWQDPTMRLYVFTPTGGNAPGYPIVLGTFTGGYLCFGPPVPVDMDRDGDLEFLVGYNMGSTSYAYARHHTGTPVAGYPVTIATGSQLYYLGVGDLTGDMEPELLALDNVLSGTNRALAFRLADGVPLAGWPYFVNDWPHGFPCVADVDGDARQDLCISTEGGQVLAINGSGVLLPGYPKTMVAPSISGVAAGDIDGDGLFELVASTWNGWIHAWDTTGPALPGRADWPMRGVDARNTGIYRRIDPAAVDDAAFGIDARVRVFPNPARGRVSFLLGGDKGSAIDILDMTGRRIERLALEGGRAMWPASSIPAGVYIARPAGVTGRTQTSRFVLLAR